MSEKHAQARIQIPKLIQSGIPDAGGNGVATAETVTKTISAPTGKQLIGVSVKVAVNVAGSGTGTAYISETVRRLTVKAPGYANPIISAVTGKAILLLAFMQALKYFGTRAGPKVGQDAVIAAAATDYVFFADVICPFPAQIRSAIVELELATLVTTGLTVSSVTTKSVVIKPLYSDMFFADQDCYALMGDYNTTTQYDEAGVIAFALAALNTDLGTLVSKLALGSVDFSQSKIYEMENEANAGLVGQNTAFGTPTINVYQPGIIAPWHATQRLFMIQHEGDNPGTFSMKATSAAYTYTFRKALS